MDEFEYFKSDEPPEGYPERNPDSLQYYDVYHEEWLTSVRAGRIAERFSTNNYRVLKSDLERPEPETSTEGNTCSQDDVEHIEWRGHDCPDWMDAENPPKGVECKPVNRAWRVRVFPRDPLHDLAHYRIPASMAPKPEPETLTPTPVFEPVVDANGTKHFVGYAVGFGFHKIDKLIIAPTAEQVSEECIKIHGSHDPKKVKRVKIYHDKEDTPEGTPGLQLEVGKSYRRADGAVKKIERENKGDEYPFVDDQGLTYLPNGQYVHMPGMCDLTEEVPNGSPATKTITLKRWLIKHGNQWHLSLWQENPPRHTGMEPIPYGKTKTVEVPCG